jgi:hypothetical protein
MSIPTWFGDLDYSPQIGDLVRYGFGSTALALLDSPHAGGFHGRQCMGGFVFVSKPARVTAEDRRMWITCAKWRNQTEEEAAREINWPNEFVDKDDSPIKEPTSLEALAPAEEPRPTATPPAPEPQQAVVQELSREVEPKLSEKICASLERITDANQIITDADRGHMAVNRKFVDTPNAAHKTYEDDKRERTIVIGLAIGMPIGAVLALLAVVLVQTVVPWLAHLLAH